MIEKFAEFLARHDFFVLTTHDPADADGLGAQLVIGCILRARGKEFRIINASAVPRHFKYMDPQDVIEQWDSAEHGEMLERAALILMDTADDGNIGLMKDVIHRAREIFVIDHHEPKPGGGAFKGISAPQAASTCELAVEMAAGMGAAIDPHAAFAAYAGIAYDTGFFAFPKTGTRTLSAALRLFELGVQPNDAYRLLRENASVGALLLQKKAVSGLTLHCGNRVAVQMLRLEDFAEAGALPEETEGFVNFPLKAKNIVVSLLLKESQEGKIRCSLRSKGMVNVAQIAQEMGGGGHVNAAGFKSEMDLKQTFAIALEKIAGHLENA